jgi:hypothetical protein
MRFSEYAKSIGKTRGYINKLYLEGRLDKAIYEDKNGQKRIHKEIADKILNGSNISNNSKSNIENLNFEFESMSYDQARRMKVYYEAQLEKFNLEKEKGKYLLAEDVKKDAYRTGLVFRNKVLEVPNQVAAEVLEMSSEFEIKNYLQECLSAAIEEAIHSKEEDEDQETVIEEDDEENESEETE